MHQLKAYIYKIEIKKLVIQITIVETQDESDWEEIDTK